MQPLTITFVVCLLLAAAAGLFYWWRRQGKLAGAATTAPNQLPLVEQQAQQALPPPQSLPVTPAGAEEPVQSLAPLAQEPVPSPIVQEPVPSPIAQEPVQSLANGEEAALVPAAQEPPQLPPYMQWSKTPANPFVGVMQSNGSQLLICQSEYENLKNPGYVVQGSYKCTIGFMGVQHDTDVFNYLDTNKALKWTSTPQAPVFVGRYGGRNFYPCKGKYPLDNQEYVGRTSDGWGTCLAGRPDAEGQGREVELIDFVTLSDE